MAKRKGSDREHEWKERDREWDREERYE